MSSIIGVIAYFFGRILLFLYTNLWFNFGLAIIALTLLVKLALLPLGIKSFNSMSKMSELQPLISELQRKYKNDPETMNKEMMKLYEEKKASPFGGCLPVLIQLPIFIGLLWVMSQPLTYMFANSNSYKNELIANEIARSIDSTTSTSPAVTAVKSSLHSAVEDLKKNSKDLNEADFKKQLTSKISAVKSTTEDKQAQALCESLKKVSNDYYLQIRIIKNDPSLISFHNNMNFLGINLADVPPDFATRKVTASNIILLIFPILSGLSTFLSAKYGQIPTNGGAQSDTQAAMQKQMLVMMPLMSVWFSMVVPVGLSLYWIISGVFQLVQQKILIDIYLKTKEANI